MRGIALTPSEGSLEKASGSVMYGPDQRASTEEKPPCSGGATRSGAYWRPGHRRAIVTARVDHQGGHDGRHDPEGQLLRHDRTRQGRGGGAPAAGAADGG